MKRLVSQLLMDDLIKSYTPDGIVVEDNLPEYLLDSNIPDNTPNTPVVEGEQPRETDEAITSEETQQGLSPEVEKQPMADIESLIDVGIRTKSLIGFHYITLDGIFVGFRIVEPHYVFIAEGTGNKILVTFDRTAGDIRAFVVGNRMYTGVLYTGATFQPRNEIMGGA